MEVFALFFAIKDANNRLISRSEILPLSAMAITTILERQPILTVKNVALKVIDTGMHGVFRKTDLFVIPLMERPGLADSSMLQDAFTMAFKATFSRKFCAQYFN